MNHQLTDANREKIARLLTKWQARAQELRQKRDFCQEHRFTLEQSAFHKQAELLDSLLVDLQLALLPQAGAPAVPGAPEELPDRELSFLAALLSQAAEIIGARVSSDLDPATSAALTPAERADLMRRYSLWNGNDDDAPPDYFIGRLDAWLSFYAARFQAQASARAQAV
jgi:hypothetical protein